LIHTAALIGLIMIGFASLLTGYRLLRGPSLPDRILALDTLTINAIALIVLFGIWSDNAINFEAALLMAVLGFISTVVLSKYLLRGRAIELKCAQKEAD
jgi:multicomponent K+:H+ antiporter subunit F